MPLTAPLKDVAARRGGRARQAATLATLPRSWPGLAMAGTHLAPCRVPPAGRLSPQEEHEFDVIGHPRADFHFAVTFPFHPPAGGRLAEARHSAPRCTISAAEHCALPAVLEGLETASRAASPPPAARPPTSASPSRPAQVTVLREYAQGPNRLAYSLPAGAFDPRKHATTEECARAELSEEVGGKGGRAQDRLVAGLWDMPVPHVGAASKVACVCSCCAAQALLAGGEWVRLLDPAHPGVPEVKWCARCRLF